MNSILFPKSIIVTEQEVDCTFMSEATKKFVVDFTQSILNSFKASGEKRGVIGIAGPPGCGKSFLSVLVQEVGTQIDSSIDIVPISIDAFHYRNDYLLHTVVSGGNLKDFKGRPDTYDVQSFIDHVGQFMRGDALRFPLYSRKIHEPIEDVIEIHEKPTLLLIEGGWLLYDKDGWLNVSPLLEKVFYIDDEEGESQIHTLKRHVSGGRTPEDAKRQYEENDVANRALILETRKRAHNILTWPN